MNRSLMAGRVAIVVRAIPHYRQRFFELLRRRLDDKGIELLLIYGQVSNRRALRRDTVEIPWGHRIHNRILTLGGRELYWQPCLTLLRGVDLVIVTHEASLLINYVLFLQHLLGIRRLALWGHGVTTRRHNSNRIGEALKALVSRRVHWWFAYTQGSAEAVASSGFPQGKITVVGNTIDLHRLEAAQDAVSSEALANLRGEINLRSENVGLYVGGMYPAKRIPFLLEACVLIKREVEDFEMIFMGAGPDERLIEQAAANADWIHKVDPRFDDAKVPYFMLSRVLLMPGVVGLALLDAFALEVPLVTTGIPDHGPEIEYLIDGVNSIMVGDADNPSAYASAVVHLLRDADALARLRAGCRQARERYTIEDMVQHFSEGIQKALAF